MKTPHKFTNGEIVFDQTNNRYGVILNTYPGEDYGEIRLDSDGNQPIDKLHKLGSRGDKGSKAELINCLIAHKSLISKYPQRYEKINY